jgi:pyridoxine/pyridoxamine 5'-phosphate oxidase
MLPIDIEHSLLQDFHFPGIKVFCQMATQSENLPRVRTVRLYGIEKEGLIFITRTTSKKWNALKNNPFLSICFLHPDAQIQLRAECKASLFNYPLTNRVNLEKYWGLVRDNDIWEKQRLTVA